ncbi:MAG: type II secretion system protein GspK [Methylacidiphilales bacterium]|nr:type II secretion system protein GspK [Candidatus Methylacidiphilales bacterium]
MMRPHHLFARRGSALILVFWCLLLLTMAVFGVVEMVELSVEHTSHEELALEARTLAMSGVALGLNPQLIKGDPLFFQRPAPDRQFQVTIQSAGARLNLNFVLLRNHREILENLFTQWGLSVEEADHVTDCLYDWVTPGDLPSLNGAKAADYAQAGLPQRPTYLPFQSMDEVKLVMGMDLVEKAKPDWEDSFTLWSSGPLNINEAPPELIAAVFSLDPQQVAYFTKTRNGQDGIAGTVDDVPVTNVNTFQAQLGISNLAMKTLGRQISLSDPNRLVESVGQAGGIQVMISVVTRLNSSPTQYFLWSEQ